MGYSKLQEIIDERKNMTEKEKQEQDRAIDLANENERKLKKKAIAMDSIAKFPLRYKDASFDNYILDENPSFRRKQIALINHLKSGYSMVMYGNNGTGKTHLAFSAIREQLLKGKTCKYILAPELYDEIKESFSKDSAESSKEILDRYARYDYLVIDEIDKTYGSATEFITLYRIINRRYESMKPVVLITNAEKSVLIDIITPSSWERVVEYPGGSMFMDWESYRKKSKTKEQV